MRERATAVHEAGHAAMAYLLRRPFAEIGEVADGNSYGRVRHAPPGEWFRPDVEITARVRRMIEDHVMICLAGAETESAWYARLPTVPPGWQEQVNSGAGHDLNAAARLAGYVCGGPGELEAYLEWLRQRVLNHTGRGPSCDTSCVGGPLAARHLQHGDDRFWALTGAFADAVQAAGTLP